MPSPPASGSAIDRLRSLTALLVVPYGFTLTIGTSVAIAIGKDGYPGPFALWLFVVGGCAAFCLAVLATGTHRIEEPRLLRPRGLSLLNLAPVAVVAATGGLDAVLGPADLRFPVIGFVSVAGYLGVVALAVRQQVDDGDADAGAAGR